MLILLAAALQSSALPPAFEPMAFLIGHCWEGKFESGETDIHCFEPVYGGQHVRDRHEVKGGEGIYRGETIYSRDGKSVSYTYWNSLGGISRGTMKGVGDRLDFGTEHHRTKDGKDIAIATHWERDIINDAYEAVTSSTQMPSMNRTVTYRRIQEITARVGPAPDGTKTLSHEAVVGASPKEVWTAIATAEGWKGWAVPTAWMDGNMLETSYSATAVRGDESTIQQQILKKESERLMSFRTIKAPKGFPHFEIFSRVTHVMELEPLPDGRTRIRLTGSGYSNDPPGSQLLTFFMEGNRISLERLRRRFSDGPIDWPKERTASAN